MKTETKTNEEYKAPKCKCVEVHINHVLCGSLDGNDIEGFEYDGDPLNA